MKDCIEVEVASGVVVEFRRNSEGSVEKRFAERGDAELTPWRKASESYIFTMKKLDPEFARWLKMPANS